jgi:hypothetical protein
VGGETGRESKGREGKLREGKKRKEKGREGKEIDCLMQTRVSSWGDKMSWN